MVTVNAVEVSPDYAHAKVLFSLLVARLLTPMMAAFFLKNRPMTNRMTRPTMKATTRTMPRVPRRSATVAAPPPVVVTVAGSSAVVPGMT